MLLSRSIIPSPSTNDLFLRGARLVEASSMPHFPETEEVLDGRSSSTHQKAVVCAPHLDEVDDTEFTDWNDGLTGVSSSFPLGYEFGNKMLAEHGGKAGDVYRLLKASTAPPPPTASMAGTSLTPASKSGYVVFISLSVDLFVQVTP